MNFLRGTWPIRRRFGQRGIFSRTGVWEEELTPDIKHRIEDEWHDRCSAPNASEIGKPPFYVLSMFPYPSGHLHMGHVRVYALSDALARFHRLNGKSVLHPMGWDAFGLPAENAAIERSENPAAWTQKNIGQMKEQLTRLGCSFDWDREVATCDPNYYKWTQLIFLRLHAAGLVYRKEATVNWDPVDQTVLAEEQVDAEGRSWRSGAKVEKKKLRQWFVRTTFFSKQLVDGLEDPELENWRDITDLQKHWIGDCCGVNFEFLLKSGFTETDSLTVWTCNPDQAADARFLALKPGHYLDPNPSVDAVKKLDLVAVNPTTGCQVPVFISGQFEYAEGCETYLGIPSISESDHKFCTSNGVNVTGPLKTVAQNVDYRLTSSKLRDWLISRQRYWGTPIPMVHCENCGEVPVAESDLPVTLPTLQGLSRRGGNALIESHEWRNVPCPSCGRDALRETDTMDTFVDSSWYYLRYLDANNKKKPFAPEVIKNHYPVDVYVGGKEHAVMHLYYARFMAHFLHSIGWLPTREPFKRLLTQGMVMGRTYRVKDTGKYLSQEQVKFDGATANEIETSAEVLVSWEKMSKSKLNGVDPEAMFQEYGVDTTRLLILADVSPSSHRNWSAHTFPGVLNWQRRLWYTLNKFIQVRSNHSSESLDQATFAQQELDVWDSRNFHLKGITHHFSFTHQISIAISKMQGLTSGLRRVHPEVMKKGREFECALAAQIIALAPLAPHFAAELWTGFVSAPGRINLESSEIQWDKPVWDQSWPKLDSSYPLDLLCKVNGVDKCVAKIPQEEFKKLNPDSALDTVMADQVMNAYLQELKVKCKGLQVFPNYQAVLSVTTEKKDKKKKDKKSKENMGKKLIIRPRITGSKGPIYSETYQ